jgi:hypothetical protein
MHPDMSKHDEHTSQPSLFHGSEAIAAHDDPTVPEKLLTRPDLLFNEINLLLLEGYVFSFSPKRYKAGGKYDFFQEIIKQPISVEFNPNYGQPGTLAYRINTIILKKLSDYGFARAHSPGLPEGAVAFSWRELTRLLGRSWSGKNTAELYDALMQIHHTTVWCAFREKSQQLKRERKFAAITLRLYSEVWFAGEGNDIEQCVVVVNPRIVRSLFERHFVCLNFDRMRSLDAIGIALYKRLFYHLSNHLDPKSEWERLSDDERAARRKQLVFKKDYADICREWLGGLTAYRYRVDIVRHLANHLDRLVAGGLLRKYELTRKVKDDGFNLVFYPGRGFFGDWEAFYGKKLGLELAVEGMSDQRAIGSPLALVAHFHRALGHKHNSFALSETNYALELLRDHRFDELKAFVDFAIMEARKSGFRMERFNALKLYVDRWFDQRTAAAERERRERAIMECGYCGGDGYLHLEDSRGTRSVRACPHDVSEIARYCERADMHRVEHTDER